MHRCLAEPTRVQLATTIAGMTILLTLPLATPAVGAVTDLALMAATCVAVVAVASWNARR